MAIWIVAYSPFVRLTLRARFRPVQKIFFPTLLTDQG